MNMAIKTMTSSSTDPSQNNIAEFTVDFNATRAAKGKATAQPGQYIAAGKRIDNAADAAAADAAADKAKAAADAAAAAAAGDKKAKPGELDDLHEEADAAKKKSGLDERFNKLTTARKEAERQRDEATARADALQAQIDAAQAVKDAAAAAKPAPKAEDFKTAEEYADALADFKVEKKLAEKAKADAKAALEAANLQVVNDWNKRVVQARKDIPDYDEVTTDSPVPVTDFLKAQLMESEVGPHILHWLAQHPQRATDINKMANEGNFKGALISFGKLAARIEDDIDAQKNEKDDAVKKDAKAKADAKAAEEASAAAAKAGKAAEIPGMTTTSRAKPPEPISRISGTGENAAVAGAEHLFDANGNFTGTPKQWRALRAAGKIN
jgi:hypothetical protein